MTPEEQALHPHDNFQPDVQVQVLRDEEAREVSVGFILSLAMSCACGIKFWFPGLRTGQSFTEPRITPDGLRVLIPMKPGNTLDMASDKLPDIAPMQSEARTRQERAIADALMNPDKYALQLNGLVGAERQNRVQHRVRAIMNALDGTR